MTTAARRPPWRLGGLPGERDAWLRAGSLAAGAAVLFSVGFTALGSMLVPGYSQLADPVSVLAGVDGPYRLVFAAGFTLSGFALAVLGVALRQTTLPGPASQAAALLLVVTGVARVLAVTLFPAAIAGSPRPLGAVHAALIAITASAPAVAAVLWALAWRQDDDWRPLAPLALLVGVAVPILWLVASSAGALDAGLFGLVERAAQGVLLFWLGAVAVQAARIARRVPGR